MQSQERGAFSKRMGWLGQAQYDSEGGVVRLRPDTKRMGWLGQAQFESEGGVVRLRPDTKRGGGGGEEPYILLILYLLLWGGGGGGGSTCMQSCKVSCYICNSSMVFCSLIHENTMACISHAKLLGDVQ